MRLIDADALIKHFEAIQKQEDAIGLDFVAIADEIKEQPTAYDPDKVVEQLEEVEKIMASPISQDCFGEECKASDCTVCIISRAIEIVKGGEIDPQSECEWHIQDAEENLYATECENRQIIFEGTPEENGYRYCPYCGRKIKAVE